MSAVSALGFGVVGWMDGEETNASISPAGPAPIMRTSMVSDGRSGVWTEGMVISVRIEATEGVFLFFFFWYAELWLVWELETGNWGTGELATKSRYVQARTTSGRSQMMLGEPIAV